METHEIDDENAFQQGPRKPKQPLVPGADSVHQATQVGTSPQVGQPHHYTAVPTCALGAGQSSVLIPPQATCNFPTIPTAVSEAVQLQARAAELRTEAAQLIAQALECEAVSGKIAKGAVQSRWEAHAAELRTEAARLQAQALQCDISNGNF